MNILTFSARRGITHGNLFGVAPLQTPSVGNPPAPPPIIGIVQMVSQLQRIGEQH